jgi:hypothetical protein
MKVDLKLTSVLAALTVFGLAAASSPAAEEKRTRDEQVQDDRKELESRTDWLYNDLDAGFAEAKRSKKPLMIVFRCIP